MNKLLLLFAFAMISSTAHAVDIKGSEECILKSARNDSRYFEKRRCTTELSCEAKYVKANSNQGKTSSGKREQ
ncbi:MAG: hypothetical protein SGI74_03170 [Oligoflexia bacterium]|nr:hypothetical protein [Oligoflexia bacterium]